MAPLAAELHPDLSTRQRVVLQTSAQSCQSCHGMINPLGFPLEYYDAVGRYRKEEHSRAIDSAGHYHTRTGETVALNNVRELADFLAGSEETHAAFVEQLFQHLAKQPIQAYGPDEADSLRRKFVEREFNMRELVADVVTAAALVPEKAD